jgi:NodT family efflux transporter outer membrane factor (OMF) lipoprotein
MTAESSQPSIRHLLGVTLCSALLAGCMAGPDFLRSTDELVAVDLVPRVDYTDRPPAMSAPLPAQWWMLFNDPVLADLEGRAQIDNLDLQISLARIEQSRAQLGIVSSQLSPTFAGGASYAHEALSEHGKFAALGAPTQPNDFWQFGFDATWEIDLWGRARRAREGAKAALEGATYDREAARVALAAEVARTYLQLRGTQAQLDVAHQNLAVAERLLAVAESREHNGVATRFETLSASAQLASSKASIPELIQHRNLLMNALASLIAAEPRTLDAQLRESMPLPLPPSRVPTGIPSELARRRPDILSAEAQLHAATAAIGVAKADFYPRVGLKGRAGVEAFEADDLGTWDSRQFSVGPTVYLPIFQGGRLQQRLALNEAKQKAAALLYRQTVLRAWHEIDNALDAWAAQRSQYAQLSISYEHSKQAFHTAQRGYQEGAADYLSVLTAQRELLSSQTRLNVSATNATLTLVNLFKALGGGWNSDEVATAMAWPSPQGAHE